MFLLLLFLLSANLIFRTHEKGDDDMRTRIGELVFVTWYFFFLFFFGCLLITSHKDDAARTNFRFFLFRFSIMCLNNGGEAGLDLRVGRRPDSCWYNGRDSIETSVTNLWTVGIYSKNAVFCLTKYFKMKMFCLLIFKLRNYYDSHGGAEFVSDLRKVDRETVSNESKENQKQKNSKIPGDHLA